MSYTLNTIEDLPAANIPLSGNELVIISQEGELVVATVDSFKEAQLKELYAHMDDHDNPHEVAFNQLMDVQLESNIIDGDLIQFDENLNVWKNIRKENVTDGGNF